jgi:hypothetical protein
MSTPIDPRKDFTDDDLQGAARRVANNATQNAEIEHRALTGYSHYYREHIVAAALEMLRTVALHERQRAGRDTSSLFPTHYNERSDDVEG